MFLYTYFECPKGHLSLRVGNTWYDTWRQQQVVALLPQIELFLIPLPCHAKLKGWVLFPLSQQKFPLSDLTHMKRFKVNIFLNRYNISEIWRIME